MNNLREERKKQGLSQFKLAIKANVTPDVIGKIENGIIKPYPGWKKKISEALQIPEQDVFPIE